MRNSPNLSNAASRFVMFAFSALLVGPSMAAPSEEILKAVIVSGSVSNQTATLAHFVRAFGAVAMRVQPRELPNYTASAVRSRPDLAAKIVNAAVLAATAKTKSNRPLLCSVVDRIIKAAIEANPGAAVEIAQSAVEANPELRDCIIAASILAAPDQKLAILEAIAGSSVLAAWSHHSSEETEGFFGGSGSISPANFSSSEGSVNSPEQAGP